MAFMAHLTWYVLCRRLKYAYALAKDGKKDHNHDLKTRWNLNNVSQRSVF